MTITELDQSGKDRLQRICEEGGRSAGSALATFIGVPDAALDVDLDEASSVEELARHIAGNEAVVVGFELSGDAGGVLVTMLRASVARQVAANLLGAEAALVHLDEPRVLGALSEVGNILVSAFLNEMSRSLGAPCLPSVPDLCFDEGQAAVMRAVERTSASIEQGAMLLEVRLDAAQQMGFELGFIPDGPVLERLGRQPAA